MKTSAHDSLTLRSIHLWTIKNDDMRNLLIYIYIYTTLRLSQNWPEN